MKRRRNTFVGFIAFIITVLLLSLVALFVIYDNFKRNQATLQKELLEKKLDLSAQEFEKGVEKFSILVLGIRSYIKETGNILSAIQLQNYLKNFQSIDYTNAFIMNYFDKDHFFRYTISERSLHVNDLSGTNLSQIRDSIIIKRMDKVMAVDHLHTQPPLRLVEGFVGLPINFRVEKDEEVVGYLTPIIDIKFILDPIEQIDVGQDYYYSYVDDNGQVVHFDKDSVYYHPYDIAANKLAEMDRISTTFSSYGQEYKISVDNETVITNQSVINFLRNSFLVLLIFIVLSGLLIYLFLSHLINAKKIEEQVHRLESMNSILKKFIYATSHDLKQPLTNINNFHELIMKMDRVDADDKILKYREIITKNIRHMRNILEDLLKYSDVVGDYSKQKKQERIDLNKVIDDIRNAMFSESIEINSSHLHFVRGVKSDFHRLLENLISNGIKFNRNEKKVIDISSEQNNGMIRLRVSDNGIGIQPAYAELVFDEFQRLERTEFEGSGLGLSICKEIVKNHGGKIWIEDNERGGTDFIIELVKDEG